MSFLAKWRHANGDPFQNIRPSGTMTPTMEMIFRTPEYFHKRSMEMYILPWRVFLSNVFVRYYKITLYAKLSTFSIIFSCNIRVNQKNANEDKKNSTLINGVGYFRLIVNKVVVKQSLHTSSLDRRRQLRAAASSAMDEKRHLPR